MDGLKIVATRPRGRYKFNAIRNSSVWALNPAVTSREWKYSLEIATATGKCFTEPRHWKDKNEGVTRPIETVLPAVLLLQNGLDIRIH
jgi:hypothetical protein